MFWGRPGETASRGEPALAEWEEGDLVSGGAWVNCWGSFHSLASSLLPLREEVCEVAMERARGLGWWMVLGICM